MGTRMLTTVEARMHSYHMKRLDTTINVVPNCETAVDGMMLPVV